ncbi:hypothetical protein NEPAR06_1254 [Nematocida parisii]|uniref:Uncharacterized protein n=1 Tax=Nematocida parisii (strain ERTm3) TaxID=935791 RepID=I3EHQ9_NEMP3|nr:uncharacterized protein NEPG_00538 [Nematocida parisii ERTm1]EIJ88756.1 hypothetical protein NEQG_01446 [Nematocida parisii ERTm3]KAI5131181.1 hypothetical protein NEPAR08_2365 [Nematocida parisii]EIJ95013.1 hypothetical protein NEPG_00538 [Nematocida parisii ERTm1]KAI5131235.1 hypothetical protein NEPAR03_2347 [Nematocida parisii]KAI5154623.1 hypothetical protein NEPAR06_1254 [Nematocida parisii]|eukprot:XP_013058369.1 hypothetical protein NEPG_00538 [Nematocida parisii ERTm1]
MGKRNGGLKRTSTSDSIDFTDSDYLSPAERRASIYSLSDSKSRRKSGSVSRSSISKRNKEGDKKKKESNKLKKNRGKKIKLFLKKCVFFPYLLAKRILKSKKKKVKIEETEEYSSDLNEKRVTFSDQVTVHTYVSKENLDHKITLSSITKSLPPVNLAMANKIKGTSRETPLVSKLLENLDKKVETLDALRAILAPKKKKHEKRSKNKIINILGGYASTDISESSAEYASRPSSKKPKESYSSKPQRRQKSHRKSKKQEEIESSEDNISSAATKAYDTIKRRGAGTSSTPI